jgi:phosphatidylserine decarboxylase
MIEIVALMIGDIQQRYSEREYQAPRPLVPGMFLRAGNPKSLFRPGSSAVVLLLEKGRVAFCPDLLANRSHPWARSRYSEGFGRKLVETDVQVRSSIAEAYRPAPAGKETYDGGP